MSDYEKRIKNKIRELNVEFNRVCPDGVSFNDVKKKHGSGMVEHLNSILYAVTVLEELFTGA